MNAAGELPGGVKPAGGGGGGPVFTFFGEPQRHPHDGQAFTFTGPMADRMKKLEEWSIERIDMLEEWSSDHVKLIKENKDTLLSLHGKLDQVEDALHGFAYKERVEGQHDMLHDHEGRLAELERLAMLNDHEGRLAELERLVHVQLQRAAKQQKVTDKLHVQLQVMRGELRAQQVVLEELVGKVNVVSEHATTMYEWFFSGCRSETGPGPELAAVNKAVYYLSIQRDKEVKDAKKDRAECRSFLQDALKRIGRGCAAFERHITKQLQEFMAHRQVAVRGHAAPQRGDL